MDTSELIRKVRKIEIKTRGISKELFSGEYQSTFKGRGMSFSEVREYQFGDDIRTIDWNVTARSDTPFVKVFEEERELNLMLLVDISASSQFGTQMATRRDLLTEISAVLAFSAFSNNDRVGLILFSDQIERYIPPKKGKKHILLIIRELLQTQPISNKTNVGTALEYLTHVMKKRSICFVLSDFFTPTFDRPLNIAARKHDVIGVHVFDPAEQTFPSAGLIHLRDLESGQFRLIDTSDTQLRQRQQLAFARHQQEMEELFQRSKADWLSIEHQQSYVLAFHRFFSKRAK